MTTPLHTRRVLSEIPERLEQLRVGATPATDDFADEPIAANVLNPTLIGNFNNSFSSVTSIPSPDEIVIRQRGRRRISLTWSPDKYSPQFGHSSSQRTPTKGNCSMVLRSSPRKRLMLSEGITTTTNKVNSPRKNDNTSPLKSANNTSVNDNGYESTQQPSTTPVKKRMKFEDSSIAQMHTSIPLPVMLKGLSQNQLIDIIKDLIETEPYLEEKIRKELPYPDLSSFEDQLTNTKKNIFKSLPSSRLSQKTDSMAYSRASIHLMEFKKNISTHCRTLNESKHWDALIDYIDIAWNYVRATPIWDNHSHNAVRRQCFKILSCHCTAALRSAGIQLGKDRLNTLLSNINDMSKDYEDIKSCLKTIDQLL